MSALIRALQADLETDPSATTIKARLERLRAALDDREGCVGPFDDDDPARVH